jgi:hypothetical protein
MPIAAVMIVAIMRIKPAMGVVFDSGIVVRDGKNVLVSETFNHKSSVIHAVAVHNPAVVKKEIDAIMRHKEWTQMEIPKMVVGNKREIVGTKAKIHVEGQIAVVI